MLQAIGTIRFRFLQKSHAKNSCLCTFKNSRSKSLQAIENCICCLRLRSILRTVKEVEKLATTTDRLYFVRPRVYSFPSGLDRLESDLWGLSLSVLSSPPPPELHGQWKFWFNIHENGLLFWLRGQNQTLHHSKEHLSLCHQSAPPCHVWCDVCIFYMERQGLFDLATLSYTARKISFLGIARPQSQFPHSCVCVRFIYSQDLSTYFPAAEEADPSWKYINLSQIYECRN